MIRFTAKISLALLLLPSLGWSQPYEITECIPKFIQLNFDQLDYDRYDEYFDDTSTYTFSQTGTWKGSDGIEEYIRFIDVSVPYWENFQRLNASIQLLPQRFDAEKGTCGIGILTDQYITFNSSLTAGDTMYFSSYQNVMFSIPENKIKTINAYWPPELVVELVRRLDTPGVHNFICNVLHSDSCTDALAATTASKSSKSSKTSKSSKKFTKKKSSKSSKKRANAVRSCERQLAELDNFEGDLAYVDGNTKGCRSVHAILAQTNPFHCAHIALEPTPDPAGNIKCFISERIDPNDLFLPEEFQMYSDFCRDSQYVDDNCHRIVEASSIDVLP